MVDPFTIRKKKFATIILEIKNEIFIIYILFFDNLDKNISIPSFCKTQIITLLTKKSL